MRPLRGISPESLYELTCNVTGQHRLLVPTAAVRSVVLGVLGRAQRRCKRYGSVRIHALIFMSTHYHLLVSADNAAQLSAFMCYVNGNIARRINKLLGRSGAFWARRFRSIPLTRDEATMRWRLRYLLAHGVKEGLVGKVEEWPGASSVPWLVRGERLYGVWVDFTKKRAAERRKGGNLDPSQWETRYEVVLTPLPCWADLPPDHWRSLVRKSITAIERAFGQLRAAVGHRPLGVDAILSGDPYARSTSLLARPTWQRRAPSVHTRDPGAGSLVVRHMRAMTAAYREASPRFTAGDWEVPFPHGMFRPGGGFVAGARGRQLAL